jgi:hypothetical protein
MIFRRVFWSFGPSIKGFKYCGPFISVDDTYLYRRYDEKLLITVVFYANNRLFQTSRQPLKTRKNNRYITSCY